MGKSESMSFHVRVHGCFFRVFRIIEIVTIWIMASRKGVDKSLPDFVRMPQTYPAWLASISSILATGENLSGRRVTVFLQSTSSGVPSCPLLILGLF